MIVPADDFLHKRTSDPFWNEVSANYFYVPERNIFGYIYVYHRPNMNCTNAEVQIWDDKFQERHDILFYESTLYNPFDEKTTEMFDFELDTGLKCTLAEPLKTYHWQYQAEECELDLTYDAVTEPFERLNANAEEGGMNKELRAYATGHYTLGARVRGWIRIGDEKIDVNCIAFHDHSWGPRPIIPQGQWHVTRGTSCFTESSSFDMWSFSEEPTETDPLLTTETRRGMGAYIKDDVIGNLVSGNHRITERDEAGRPLRAEVEAKDHLGRDLYAVGTCKNWYKWCSYGRVLDTLSLCEWEFDGMSAYGSHEELSTLRQNRRIQRALRSGELVA